MRPTIKILSFAGAAMGLAAIAAPLNAGELPATVVAKPGTTKLQPVSPWSLDFAENRCRLVRLFGDKEKPHLLMFEQAAPGPSFGLTMGGPEVKTFRNSRRIHIGAESDEPLTRVDWHGRGDIASVGPAVILPSFGIGRFNNETADEAEPENREPALRMAGIDLEEAKTIERFVLKRGRKVLSFETGNMMPPFQALDVCTSDLLRDWGLDPKQHTSYSSPKWTNQDAVVRRIVDRYPRGALNIGEQGIFRMRVIVETDGTVSDCHLEKSTQTKRLESPACEEMRKAVFEPARDAEGQPMKSFFATSVTYRVD